MSGFDRPEIPRPETPLQKLSNRRWGFNETVIWKPGFDDPDIDAAGGTPAIALNMRVRYEPPRAWPQEIYITLAPPHLGTDPRLATQCEDAGRMMSFLLRHGWTPALLIEHSTPGGLMRCGALHLRRQPMVVWQEPER